MIGNATCRDSELVEALIEGLKSVDASVVYATVQTAARFGEAADPLKREWKGSPLVGECGIGGRGPRDAAAFATINRATRTRIARSHDAKLHPTKTVRPAGQHGAH